MELQCVYDYLNKIAPFSTQMGFDNAGFLVGDQTACLTKAVVALDVTDGAIEFAKEIGANLIVTHHPIIFNPLKSVLNESLVYKLINSGIAVISAHTNLDMAKDGVNDTLCKTIGLKKVKSVIPCGECFEARVGELSKPLNCDEFAAHLKAKLGGTIKYVGGGNIKTVGVCSGSGGDLLEQMKDLQVDAFVTADVKHSIFILADTFNISLYDCGHFNTEDVIVNPLTEKLNKNVKEGKFFAYHSDIIKSI